MSKRREYLILAGIVCILFPVILLGTGTIFSGWHLVDDSETVRLVDEHIAQEISFWPAFRHAYYIDITHRWRPAYWFLRVLGAYLFGMNSVLHNLFLCLVGMGTYILLYLTARNLKSCIVFAHLFSMLAVLGRQYEVWYRIANQENIGLFLLCVSLYCIARQEFQKQWGQKKYDILLVNSICICGLFKESFFVTLPGVILLRLLLEVSTLKKDRKAWWKLLWRRWTVWVPPLAIFMWSFYMIFFYVGTAPIDYAGVDMDAGWKQTVWNILRMRKESLEDYFWLTVVCIILLIIFVFMIKPKKEISVKENWIWLAFGGYLMITEIILYAKSGMWDRYLIPFIVGLGIFLILWPEKIIKRKRMLLFYGLFLGMFLCTRARISIIDRAAGYAEEGRQLQAVLEYVHQNVEEDKDILIRLEAPETDNAMKYYLNRMEKNADLYYDVETGMQETKEWEVFLMCEDVAEQETDDEIIDVTGWKSRKFGDEFLIWEK